MSVEAAAWLAVGVFVVGFAYGAFWSKIQSTGDK